MVFNINDYTNGCYVMHCATIFEAKSFTLHLHSLDKRWSDGNKYSTRSHWNAHKEETAYNFNRNVYGRVSDYRRDGYTVLEWKDFMYDMPSPIIDKVNLYDRNIVTIAGIDFIMFPEENGAIPIVTTERWCDTSFGNTSNLAESSVLRELTTDFLPQIEAAIGKENVLEFETDLTSLHGDKTYGTTKSKIAIPTFDFYRKHNEIFKKYVDDINRYWWLSTPWDIHSPNGDISTRLVILTEVGMITCDRAEYAYAVRPILYIKADALTVHN